MLHSLLKKRTGEKMGGLREELRERLSCGKAGPSRASSDRRRPQAVPVVTKETTGIGSRDERAFPSPQKLTKNRFPLVAAAAFQSVMQAVAEIVAGGDDEQYGGSRREHEPRVSQQGIFGFAEHGPPFRRGGLDAEPKEGKRGERQNEGPRMQRCQHESFPCDLRQNMPPQDMRQTVPHDTGKAHGVCVRILSGDAAHHARVPGPFGQDAGQEDMFRRGAEQADQGEDQHFGRSSPPSGSRSQWTANSQMSSSPAQ